MDHVPESFAGCCTVLACGNLRDHRANTQEEAEPSWLLEKTVVMHRLLRRPRLALKREGSRWRAVIAKRLENHGNLS